MFCRRSIISMTGTFCIFRAHRGYEPFFVPPKKTLAAVPAFSHLLFGGAFVRKTEKNCPAERVGGVFNCHNILEPREGKTPSFGKEKHPTSLWKLPKQIIVSFLFLWLRHLDKIHSFLKGSTSNKQ